MTQDPDDHIATYLSPLFIVNYTVTAGILIYPLISIFFLFSKKAAIGGDRSIFLLYVKLRECAPETYTVICSATCVPYHKSHDAGYQGPNGSI